MEFFVRIIRAIPGRSCPPTTLPAWCMSSHSPSTPGLPTPSTRAPGTCLTNLLMVGRVGRPLRTESLTTLTSSPLISTLAILTTSSRLPVVEFMKPGMLATAGLKCRVFLLSREGRAPLSNTHLYPGWSSPALQKGSGVQTVAAKPTRGWSPLRDSSKSIPSPFTLHDHRRFISAPTTTVSWSQLTAEKTSYLPTEDTAADLPT